MLALSPNVPANHRAAGEPNTARRAGHDMHRSIERARRLHVHDIQRPTNRTSFARCRLHGHSVAAHSSEPQRSSPSAESAPAATACLTKYVRTVWCPCSGCRHEYSRRVGPFVGLYRPYAYGRPKCMDRRCLASFSFLFLCTKTVTVLVHVLSRLHSTCRMHWSMSGSARRTEIDTDNVGWRLDNNKDNKISTTFF